MDITITIDSAEEQRVINALCVAGGNGPAGPDAAKQSIIDWVKATTENVNRSEYPAEAQAVKPVEGVS